MQTRARAAIAVFCLSSLFTLESFADTIFLKDGNQIMDCKIVKETQGSIFVKTKNGDMVVPRTAIQRVLKQKTVYDLYAEQRAKVRKGDAQGLYKLALWTRSREELRGETDKLLGEALKIDPAHTGAHKLLGHIKIGKEWIVPTALSLRFPSNTDKQLLSNLDLFLKTRSDIGLATGRETNAIDVCDMHTGLTISRKSAPKIFGQSIGGGNVLVASLGFQTRCAWLGKKGLKTSLNGMVPATAGATNAQAINNAFGNNSRALHLFFDRIVKTRRLLLEKELKAAAKKSKKTK